MKRKNIVAMVTSLALVGVVAVGGTLALLTEQSNIVTNTFTIGNGYADDALVLDEAYVERDTSSTNYGGYTVDGDQAGRNVSGNNYTDLVAETTLAKDPTFHLAAGSPDSWIIAKVSGVDEESAAGIKIVNSVTSGVADYTLPDDYGWAHFNVETGEVTPVTDYQNLTNGYYIAINSDGTPKVFVKDVDNIQSTDDLFEMMYVTATVDRDAVGERIVVKGVAIETLADSWNNEEATAVKALVVDKLG